MKEEIILEEFTKTDEKIFNTKDTLRYLKDGIRNKVILLKLLLNIISMVFIIAYFIFAKNIEEMKIIGYITGVLVLIFLRNGKLNYLLFAKKEIANTIDLSSYSIAKFSNYIHYCDENIIKFKNITLESNPYIFNKSKRYLTEAYADKLMVVICAIKDESIYIIDIWDLDKYTKSYKKLNRKWSKWLKVFSKKRKMSKLI